MPTLSPTVADAVFTAIDFESAGASRGATDVPVQIGTARMENMAIAAESLFVSYLATDQPVQWSARKVHGITDADLAGAPELLSLWPQIRQQFKGTIAVAHGAGTEKRFLRSFPFHPITQWVDTLQLARKALPDHQDYALSTLCNRFDLAPEIASLCPNRQWHDALYDSVACLLLLRTLIQKAQLSTFPLDAITHRVKPH